MGDDGGGLEVAKQDVSEVRCVCACARTCVCAYDCFSAELCVPVSIDTSKQGEGRDLGL